MSGGRDAGPANCRGLPAAKAGSPRVRAGLGNFADRRRQRGWVPGSAALLTMLIGLSDIVAIFKPDWPDRLHKYKYLVPGTLSNVTRSADVIIGLMLLFLAHGLRRRKRRAWPAVAALLAFDVAIHIAPSPRVMTPRLALGAIIERLSFRHQVCA